MKERGQLVWELRPSANSQRLGLGFAGMGEVVTVSTAEIFGSGPPPAFTATEPKPWIGIGGEPPGVSPFLQSTNTTRYRQRPRRQAQGHASDSGSYLLWSGVCIAPPT